MPRKLRAKSPKKKPKSTKKIQKISKKLTKQQKRRKLHAKLASKAPQLNSPAFNRLRNEWYAKLKAQGFNDLESTKHSLGLDGPLSTSGAQPCKLLQKAKLDNRETYYRRITNFVAHNTNWARDKCDNTIASLYINGVAYRKIVAHLKLDGISVSIWYVHTLIKRLEKLAVAWNRANPEGLDFEPDLEPDFKLARMWAKMWA